MYVPHFNRIEDEDAARAFVRDVAVGTLVTVGPDGAPDATLLPVLWLDDRIVAHFARANAHWQRIGADAPGLVVVQGLDAYVSPAWYPSKAEHGKVVPTWNYSAVQLRGPVTVHDDVDWLREAVTELTDRHEADRPERWAVTDAPQRYVQGQLRAIVGVEMRVEQVDAKAKWSQNRSAADREGVAAAYKREGNGGPAERVRTGSL
ncbi:MAG: FMN-binding negative transcriptional regulator [Tomitella sp.]|uniref:FMN-binding negative transcriptional regulator n=1 Tax=Intrasporangium sp. TaxID=1925024 RepID=UPI0026492AC8|nr:FMN-binding negative transcriptional regulator [Intrasporangium sp.]MDN5759544.1 FMN-binding negative transcriptional regulator [Tomitella sp.]MDN5796249.1 FMN-binding negative transcriptional regulator [Intrasporangium sp.]